MTTGQGASSRRVGPLEAATAIGGFAVFVVLWAGLAYSLLVDPSLPDRVWAWLRGLETIPQAVVWIAILPIAVGLWAWTSSGPPLVVTLVVLGMVAWTLVAVGGLLRVVRSR